MIPGKFYSRNNNKWSLVCHFKTSSGRCAADTPASGIASVQKLAHPARATLRAARRDPPFCPEQSEGTTKAPPLLLLTVQVSVHARASSDLFHLPPGTRREDARSSRRAVRGRAGRPGAHAHRGASPAAERAPQGPALPPALARLESSCDKLLPAAFSEPPPRRAQRGAHCSTRPSDAGRGGSLEVNPDEGPGPPPARSLAEACQAFLLGAPARGPRLGFKPSRAPSPALTSAPRWSPRLLRRWEALALLLSYRPARRELRVLPAEL